MTRGKWYSAWCPLFESLLQEKDLGISDFAVKTGEPHNNISQYIHGVVRPPLAKVEAWADLLGLEDGRKQWFVRLAHLAHTPKFVQQEMEAIREELKESLKLQASTIARVQAQGEYIERLKALLLKHGIEPPPPSEKGR